MEERFIELALISSVLGGFSFSYVTTLLALESKKKIVFYCLLFAMISCASLILAALGWSFLAIEERADNVMHQNYVRLFLLGLFTMVTGLGISGFLRNRASGIASSIICFLAMIILFNILSNYITL